MTIKQKIYDVFIIGGGINGVGIAADAASRGLSVCLAEQQDLAQGTSSASSKLIHGGLRYLEYYEFKMVREALKERQLLLQRAPHLVYPLKFLLPHHVSMRPTWLMRLGLWFYDYLNKDREIENSSAISFNANDSNNALMNSYLKGFSYTDCSVDDSRLVVMNAMLAKEYGANILTRHKVIKLISLSSCWKITVLDQETQAEKEIMASVIINASGPWFNQFIHQFSLPSQYQAQLIKGSHIVVPKLYEDHHAYTLQNHDGRIIFAIPFLDQFTLIGTTDVIYHDNLENIPISNDEIDYLCKSINEYFKNKIAPHDVVWQFSGIRALKSQNAVEPKALSRDYQIELTYKNNLPLLNILGGKITTYRSLAQQAVDHLKRIFPACGPSVTHSLKIPGGNIDALDMHSFYEDIQKQYSFLPPELLKRLVHSYGMQIHTILASVNELADLGKSFGNNLYECEINYLKEYEWAKSAEDILWRRTKLGLFFSAAEKNKLEKFFKNA